MMGLKDIGPSIAVAGHLVYDEIVFPSGKSEVSLGGISYNIAALCAMMRKGRLYCVCRIGSDRKAEFDRIFEHCPVLDNSLIKTADKLNVVNRLVYSTNGSREEWNSRIPEPISLQAIPAEIDALLMNFISGDDVLTDDLDMFRRRFDGVIYLDYHSLALGHNPDGSRFYRYNKKWMEYVSAADILQLNAAELFSIVGQSESVPEAIAVQCRMLHEQGPGAIIVTMGNRGAVISGESGERKYFIPPLNIVREMDSTGCGDTLAAVTLYNYLISGDILSSAIEGSRWATAKATFSGLQGFSSIQEILDRIGPSPKLIVL